MLVAFTLILEKHSRALLRPFAYIDLFISVGLLNVHRCLLIPPAAVFLAQWLHVSQCASTRFEDGARVAKLSQ